MACCLLGTKPFLNKCWFILNWTPGNNLQITFHSKFWHFLWKKYISNIVCTMCHFVASQCVKILANTLPLPQQRHMYPTMQCPGPRLNIKTAFLIILILITKIRWPYHHLIFIIGTATLVWLDLYTDMAIKVPIRSGSNHASGFYSWLRVNCIRQCWTKINVSPWWH